jgi:hypothetical protein
MRASSTSDATASTLLADVSPEPPNAVSGTAATALARRPVG